MNNLLKHLSIFRLMTLWGELVELYCQCGEDNSTIFYPSTFSPQYTGNDLEHVHAFTAMHELFMLFKSVYSCDIYVDGRLVQDMPIMGYMPNSVRVSITNKINQLNETNG